MADKAAADKAAELAAEQQVAKLASFGEPRKIGVVRSIGVDGMN